MAILISISSLSDKEGFVDWGFAPVAETGEDYHRFREYISRGENAGMGYLARNMEKRKDPSLLVPGARSVISFLAPYSSIKSSVAAFALGEDYHDVIKDKLRRISLHLSQECAKHGLEYQGRCFTDSAPVMERYWAAEAGLGFIGRNNFLISPKHGLRTLIGVIICNIPPEWLGERKEKIAEGCGECRRCIDACPEGALYAPFRLDARKCISYHTIESHELYSARPVEYKGQIFGCEICLRACPYDRESEGWEELRTNAEEILSKSPQDWLDMDDKEFKERFDGTPLCRGGLDKIKNNL
ncbi:MAG: tRNA epoxyqueuosine(34) reductase QueG [Bacteroidales bacterium]|jgi:epoxyqueuosine reductase|nr:tRNA epoxyqueuosine(34) reductase QueG [Bacteroidales bacterium]